MIKISAMIKSIYGNDVWMPEDLLRIAIASGEGGEGTTGVPDIKISDDKRKAVAGG